ncbi:MAG: DUF5618 family protein [Bacteroidales bacterium]|nr:DUF5618 family protein [Bacteroidales bacterium]
MKDPMIEIVRDPVSEAHRYVENARETLKNNAKLDPETNSYTDRKYVKAAGHYLWNGVLIILNTVFHVNEKKGRVNIDDYRMAVGPRDRKLLASVNNAYDILHLHMGYDGVLDKTVCNEGIRLANEIIDRCAVMLP